MIKIKAEKKREIKKDTKVKKPEFYHAVGRRKESNARIRLYSVTGESVDIGGKPVKKGDIIVNNLPVEKYFSGEIAQKSYLEPFRITNTLGRFAVSAIVSGGGLYGQLGAFVHGVSRALTVVDDEKFRPILRKKGFMTRDPRAKERRKAGLAQSARAKKQSPKR